MDGVFQEYVAHDAGLCFKLPDNMSTMEGALIEPLAVGIHAANLGEAHMGQTAVVTGSGCIGLVSLMAMKAMGVSKVYVVDVMETRLQKALECGADGVINGATQDVVAEVMRLTEGRGTDLVIETAGAEVTTRQAIQMAKEGSTVVLVGLGASGELTLPMAAAINKELTLKGLRRYRHCYPMAIQAVASGRIDLKRIVTNEFTFDQLPEALDICIQDKAHVVKGVIKISD